LVVNDAFVTDARTTVYFGIDCSFPMSKHRLMILDANILHRFTSIYITVTRSSGSVVGAPSKLAARMASPPKSKNRRMPLLGGCSY
jgi:hypothetical protein